MATSHSTPAPLSLPSGLSREFLLHHRVCPKQFGSGGTVIVALAPDGRPEALDDIAFAYRREVVPEEASVEEVERLIERLTTRAERAIELERGIGGEGDDGLTADVRDLANQPPVVRYVNLLVNDAHDAGASDIHLEATRSGLSARFRLDGVLVAAPESPAELHHAYPAAYWMPAFRFGSIPSAFHGTLMTDKTDASGQLFRRNRYYDPLTGRFTQEDPIGLAGGLNAYGFANGDPVNFSDPFGLCPIEADGIPCALTMGAVGAGGGMLTGALWGAGGGTLVVPGVGTVAGGVGGAAVGGTVGLIAGTSVGAARDLASISASINWGRIGRTIGLIGGLLAGGEAQDLSRRLLDIEKARAAAAKTATDAEKERKRQQEEKKRGGAGGPGDGGGGGGGGGGSPPQDDAWLESLL